MNHVAFMISIRGKVLAQAPSLKMLITEVEAVVVGDLISAKPFVGEISKPLQAFKCGAHRCLIGLELDS